MRQSTDATCIMDCVCFSVCDAKIRISPFFVWITMFVTKGINMVKINSLHSQREMTWGMSKYKWNIINTICEEIQCQRMLIGKKNTKPNVNITHCADCTVGSNAMHALDDILAARNEYTMWWHSFSFGYWKKWKKETEIKTKRITELCSTAFTGINKKYIPVPLEMYLFSSIEMWFLPRNCKCTSNSLDLFVNIDNECGGAAEMDENSSMFKNNNNSFISVGLSSEMSINTIVWMRIAHFCSVIGRSRHAIVFFYLFSAEFKPF